MIKSIVYCLKKICGRTIKNNKGAAGVFVLFFVFVFILAFGAIMQWMQANTIKENVDRELRRAVNISIDLSMRDEYRSDHISRINVDIAKEVFYLYLLDELQLDVDMNRYTEGKLEYQLVLDDLSVSESPPEFSVEGRVIVDPLFFKDLIGVKLEIPVKAKARNQRLE